MALLQQILIQPGPLPAGASRSVRLTRDDLRRCRENTLALMQQGAEIPVLLGHAASGSVDGGPRLPTDRARDPPAAVLPAAGPAHVGRLVDLIEVAGGSLAAVVEIDDGFLAATAAARAPPRFTSPEIRPCWHDGRRKRDGPLVAHLALTDRPLCPGQTPLKAVFR